MKALLSLAVLFCVVFGADPALPTINLSLNSPQNAEQLVNSLNVLLILTALALAPSLIFMMTSFFAPCHCIFIFASSDGYATSAAFNGAYLACDGAYIFHHGASWSKKL